MRILFLILVVMAALPLRAAEPAMVDYYPARPPDFSFEVLARPMLNLSLAIISAAILIALLARFLPELPLFRRLFLSARSLAGPSIPAVAADKPALSVGDTGTARSILRPSGKAVFGGTLVESF